MHCIADDDGLAPGVVQQRIADKQGIDVDVGLWGMLDDGMDARIEIAGQGQQVLARHSFLALRQARQVDVDRPRLSSFAKVHHDGNGSGQVVQKANLVVLVLEQWPDRGSCMISSSGTR